MPDASIRDVPPAAATSRGIKRGLLLAMLASAATVLLVPAETYRTEAIVGVGDAATPLRSAMAEAAARAAVSKPVISQAAGSLIDARLAAPAPNLLARLSVFARLDAASGQDARLASALRDAIAAVPGDAPGVVRVTAAWPDAAGAARIATAVAEALVADQDNEAAEARTRRQAEASHKLDGLRAAAASARERFASLGGSDLDPARSLAAATAQTSAAQGRLDVVRTILASGSPPISERHDLPEHVAALQSAYLDQSEKLTIARETYGERHTIVISLSEGVKRAASALTAEWRRLGKVAETELAAAHDREAALRQPEKADKRAAIESARLAVLASAEAVSRAERTSGDVNWDQPATRLLAPAPVPLQASGLALVWRLLLAALAGGAAFVGARRWFRESRVRPAPVAERSHKPADAAPRAEPRFFAEDETEIEDIQERPVRDVAALRDIPRPPVRQIATGSSPLRASLSAAAATHEERIAGETMADILIAFDQLARDADLPTVLLATLGEGRETTPVAAALVAAAVGEGLRVLFVEPEQGATRLAALAERDAEPVLVDLFGVLRVALRAEGHDGMAHVVPALRNGQSIAARLARNSDVLLVDDLRADFDLVVIDGGHVDDCAALSGLADAVLRVGRHPSSRDDDALRARLDIVPDAFLGTIAASTFVPKPDAEVSRPAVAARSIAPERHRGPQRPAVHTASAPRRRVNAR